MKRPGVIVIAVLGALLAGLLVYGLVQRQDKRSIDAAIRAGKRPPAPDKVLPFLDGKGSASLRSYRGRVVFLNFWASWCPPCSQEAPLLERFQKRLGAQATVLGVTYKDYAADSRRFENKHGLTYPSLYDGHLQLAPEYGTNTLPETFVIDRRGRIVDVRRGEVDQAFLDHGLRKAEGS